MAHGLKHRGLDRVAPPESLSLHRFARKSLAVGRDRNERRQRWEESSPDRKARSRAFPQVERSEPAASRGQLERRLPFGRLLRRPENDARAFGTESLGDRRREALELVGRAVSLEEGCCHLGEKRLLAPALLGLGGPFARPGREVARHDADDEIDDECEPVLAVREAQSVERREEQEVEEARAPNRNSDRIGATEENRHRQDRKQVEDAQAEHGHERLADVDEARRERERGRRDCNADQPPSCGGRAEQPLDLGEDAHRRNVALKHLADLTPATAALARAPLGPG